MTLNKDTPRVYLAPPEPVSIITRRDTLNLTRRGFGEDHLVMLCNTRDVSSHGGDVSSSIKSRKGLSSAMQEFPMFVECRLGYFIGSWSKASATFCVPAG